ncbi:MAG: DNA-3-methyladenine glycosylase I [Geminicoccaceae bacterium]|nr:DNA-3-methyladenine glycosylase I [Geminicoccaceae bacterium]
MSVAFAAIEEAALARHGRAAIEARLVQPRSQAELRALGEDRYLSAMSLRIFRAGLRHALVDAKWPAFEEVFAGFDPELCARLSDERIEELLADRRLVRNLPKLRAVRANARAILDLRAQVGGIGAWIADWPSGEIVALWDELARRFEQLGGNSAPQFLRMVGKDTFLPTDAVVRALLHWGVLDRPPTTGALRAAMQAAFAGWQRETGRPLCQLSQILAMSVD